MLVNKHKCSKYALHNCMIPNSVKGFTEDPVVKGIMKARRVWSRCWVSLVRQVKNVAGRNEHEMEAGFKSHLALAYHSSPIVIVAIRSLIVANKLHLKIFPC